MVELFIGLLFITVAGVALARHPWLSERRGPVRARLRDFWAGYRELAERQALLRRPWLEESLHWSRDGEVWRLHGHLEPPRGRHSTTRNGWCPAARGHQPEH